MSLCVRHVLVFTYFVLSKAGVYVTVSGMCVDISIDIATHSIPIWLTRAHTHERYRQPDRQEDGRAPVAMPACCVLVKALVAEHYHSQGIGKEKASSTSLQF